MDIISEVLIGVNERRKEGYQTEIKLYKNILNDVTGAAERTFINYKIKECERIIEEYNDEIEKLKKGA